MSSPSSQKILYILPNIVYVADLLATKKEYTFSIHSFRQINGQFLDDNEFVRENLSKLVDKLDEGSYQLVLPDYLFTNTIVGVKESSEQKVKTYLNEKLLPSLDVNDEEFQIDTYILTQHAGEYKVQLTFLEKSVLAVLKEAIGEKKIEFSSITSLSWTLKSIVSLEPSITVVQMGENLFLAQQYIGLDQTSCVPVVEAENIVETVKTLKGAEPSIQTVYLLASELVEEKLRLGLASTLPIQQLASFKEKETEMPSYVKQAIEACARTMVIPDFIIPKFNMNVVKIDARIESANVLEAEDEKEEQMASTISEAENDLPLPTPNTLPIIGADDLDEEVELEEEADEIAIDLSLESEDKDGEDEKKGKNESEIEISVKEESISEVEIIASPEETSLLADSESSNSPIVSKIKSEHKKEEKIVVDEDLADVDMESLKNFFSQESTEKDSQASINDSKESTTIPNSNHKDLPTKKIIKDNSGLGNMLKMFFIVLASFFATVGIGVGLGLGFLSFSGNGSDSTVVEVVEPSPTQAPSPTPSPTPAIVRKDIDVLVVNATTKAGYAGRIANSLKSAGFENVKTGNAKGDYEDGNYLLGDEDMRALLNDLKEELELELSFKTTKNIEDPKSEFDLVVVLAE